MPKYRVIVTNEMHYELIIEADNEEAVEDELESWDREDFEYHAIPADSYGSWKIEVEEEE